MDNKFDMQRVAMLMRLYWASDAKRHFSGFLALMGALLGLIIYYIINSSSVDIGVYQVFLALIMVFGMCYSGSVMAKPLADKPRCIDFMMTPASMLEKFTARALFYVAGFWIVFIACTIVIDLVQYSMSYLYEHTAHRMFFLDIINDFDPIAQIIIPATMLLFWQSVFVVGGTVWPKRGMVLTVAYLLVMSMSLSLFFGFIVSHWGLNWARPQLPSGHHLDFDMAMWILSAFNLALTAFNYVLAYHRLKEAEIVQRW